jgi:hypothetical protein
MSALPPKADIVHGGGNVRFVPQADMVEAGAVGAAAPKSWCDPLTRKAAPPYLSKYRRSVADS